MIAPSGVRPVVYEIPGILLCLQVRISYNVSPCVVMCYVGVTLRCSEIIEYVLVTAVYIVHSSRTAMGYSSAAVVVAVDIELFFGYARSTK